MFVLLLVFAAAAWAQRDTGQITGTVRDPSGAVITDAKVTVTSTTTGMVRESTTNMAGLVAVAGLPPDTYEVTVEASGFQKFVQKAVVTVGATTDLPVELKVSGTSTTVEVAESAVAVNTDTQTLSQTVSSRQLDDLPTSPTRNPYALVAISGNVAEDAGGQGGNRGAGFSINGQRSASTDILLDGADNVDAFNATYGQQVPLDSVQEFSVLTNNFTAEYGRASGGVVNLVTKSGSNEFHGSAYEFNRISDLSSNTFENNALGIDRPVFARNDFGFSVGGPIKKNKLFFFENAEWIRVRSAAPTEESIIDPGSYSAMAPASQAFFAQYGKLAPGTQIVATLPCLKGSPLNCDVVSYSVPSDAGGGTPQNTWMQVARVDYSMTDKTTISGRYAGYNEMDFVGSYSNSPYAGYNTGDNAFDQNAALTVTHVFSPALVNSTKLVYNRLNALDPLGANPVGPAMFMTETQTGAFLGFPMVFPGYESSSPGEAIPFGGPQNLYQIYNDVSWTKGKHQFKFGGQYIQIRDDRTFAAYQEALEALGTNVSSGLANLVSGNIYSFQGAVYPQGKFPCTTDSQGNQIVNAACTVTLPATEPQFSRSNRFNDFAFYAQDSWKVSPRLTVNLGLRWEYYGVQHDANPNLDANFVLGQGSNFFEQIRNGTVETSPNGGVLGTPDYKDFGPRIGFAYDVFGDGSTAIRGGYSIGYERNFGNVTFNAMFNPPNYAVVDIVSGSTAYPTLPVYTNDYGPLAGSGSAALPSVELRAINQHMPTAYAETWSLSIDRKLSKNSTLQLSYSGSHGVHLYDIANINQVDSGVAFLGDTNAGNPLNYQYGSINYRSDGAFSHYNALNVKYTANNLLNKGLTATVNYTWSHSLDNLSSTFTDALGGTASSLYQLGYLDAFNPRLNWGNSDFDIRHRLVASAAWDIPWLKNSSNPFLRHVVGGWLVSSIVNIRTGAPFSLYDCTNATYGCPEYAPSGSVATTGTPVPTGAPNNYSYISLAPPGGAIPDVGNSLGTPNCTQLYHQGCTYTNNGAPYPERNQFFGPGYWTVDGNIFKNFQLTERFKLQIRAEMYNLFNHSNQYVNVEALDVSGLASTPYVQTDKGGALGIPGTTSDERRNIQFGVRLTF
jgi:outer membrane receptor protein involved in Fe transport